MVVNGSLVQSRIGYEIDASGIISFGTTWRTDEQDVFDLRLVKLMKPASFLHLNAIQTLLIQAQLHR